MRVALLQQETYFEQVGTVFLNYLKNGKSDCERYFLHSCPYMLLLTLVLCARFSWTLCPLSFHPSNLDLDVPVQVRSETCTPCWVKEGSVLLLLSRTLSMNDS